MVFKHSYPEGVARHDNNDGRKMCTPCRYFTPIINQANCLTYPDVGASPCTDCPHSSWGVVRKPFCTLWKSDFRSPLAEPRDNMYLVARREPLLYPWCERC